MILIAHRGDAKNYPENTIPAFVSALKLGADGVELDVQYESGELIVVHNYIHDSGVFPRLADVLAMYPLSSRRLEIELKAFSPEIVPALLAALTGVSQENIELTSSVQPLLPLIREAFPHISVGLILPDKSFEPWMTSQFHAAYALGLARLTRASTLHLPSRILTSDLVDRIHAEKLLVHSHIFCATLSEEKGLYDHFLQLGVDQCTFDDVGLLSELHT